MTTYACSSALLEPTAADTAQLVQAESPHLATGPNWSLPTRLAFRFTFVYLGLYCAPYVLEMIPYVRYVSQKYFELVEKVVPWVARHILHLQRSATFAISGSSDTTFDYVLVLCCLVISLLATILWSLLDHKRPNYQKLHQGLRYLVRFYLGSTMLAYGAMKVVPHQMSAPSLGRLLEPLGDFSPMGLLWTFMGASRPYETFCGAVEMLGGILLFVPPLTALGALVCIGAMTNVFMLNMCYDVPVKVMSFHLLLLATFLLAPDLRNVADFLIFQRPTRLSAHRPLSRRKWLNWTAVAAQVLIGIGLAGSMLHMFNKEVKARVKSPYYGVWSVEQYAVDGTVIPPSLTEATRWRRVILDSPQVFTLQYVDAPQTWFLLDLDQGKQSFTLTKRGDEKWKAVFSYQHPTGNILIFDGQINGHNTHAQLRRMDGSRFTLTSTGFHWISEQANQR